MTQPQPHSRDEFDIAIICALEIEYDAVLALFDEDFGDIEDEELRDDPNTYTGGMLGNHKVALCLLPGMGKKEAAQVATHFVRSFPKIELGLLVGICGGAPENSAGDEILLGDVIVSTAVIQYDLARQYTNRAIRKDTVDDNLPRPTTRIRALLKSFRTEKKGQELLDMTYGYLQTVLTPERVKRKWGYPGATKDMLFRDDYEHQHPGASNCPKCSKSEICPEARRAQETKCEALCDKRQLCFRDRLEEIITGENSDSPPKPLIHFGQVASGDRIMRSSVYREQLIEDEKVIGFEMEGAGVWDQFPTIVIKGVCDYSDSHKSKIWQRYASATAASCMKAILAKWHGPNRREKSQNPSAGGSSTGSSPAQGMNNTFSGNFNNTGQSFMGNVINSGGGSMHF